MMRDRLIGLGIAAGCLIPIIGPFDDIVVVALALRYAGRHAPRDVLQAAWPGEPRLIERLLGPDPTNPASPTIRS